MPAQVVGPQKQSTVNRSKMTSEKYNFQPRGLEPSGIEDMSSGGMQLAQESDLPGFLHDSNGVLQLTETVSEGRVRKKLQKSPQGGSGPQRRPEVTAADTAVESTLPITSRRRSSVRDQKVPLGARPLESSPSKNLQRNHPPVSYRSASSSVRQAPHSRQASNSNISSFNFGTASLEPTRGVGISIETYPSLPSVNFDDFHTSLAPVESLPNSLHGYERNSGTSRGGTVGTGERTNKGLDNEIPRRSDILITRSGSYVQRQTSISRVQIQPSSSTSKIETMGPHNAPLAIKGRRQSHFSKPPSSNSTHIRPPRKSIGPGIIPNNSSEDFLEVRTSLKGELNENGGHLLPSAERSIRACASKDVTSVLWEDHQSFLSMRNAKAKSMHAPPSLSHDYLSASSLTPDNSWTMPFSTTRPPIRSADQGASTSMSSRRLSVMPGHATGLGARTISPTDARRLKRMSMMQNPPPLPFTPPASLPDPGYLGANSTAESPSFIPRKSVTPSSNRTTPDPNRKSYCSIVSTSSNTSYSSTRPLAITSRLAASASLSRLPTLKSRNEPTTNGVDEEVPPVPAIPKAFESPKNELELPYFAPRKSSLTDATSLNSNPTVDRQLTNSLEKYPPMPQSEFNERRAKMVNDTAKADEQAILGAHSSIRNLQPLRLPPLNLLPLNTPTVDRIAALHDRSVDTYLTSATPPPGRGQLKTPSTPMTASKATFFSRHEYKDEPAPLPAHARSSSSHYALRSESSSYRAASSSGLCTTRVADTQPTLKAVSPFVSSSLPKSSLESISVRSKTTGDRSLSTAGLEHRTSYLTGPRLQTSTKAAKVDTLSQPSSPIDAEGHSFGTALRRKLSLNRKRSLSKVEIATERDSEYPPQPPKHDAMPPPRLPASATWSGPWLSNPSPLQKPSYLQSRRKADEATADGAQDKNFTPSLEHSTHVTQQRSHTAIGMDVKSRLRAIDPQLDRHDLIAEEEMKELALRQKDTESAARELDDLKQRAVPKEKVSPPQALRTARLNIFERGEIVDFKEIYFCGTQTAKKFTGDLEAESANFGYDDERGDYNIVKGDHLSYRYEIIDILGKGSFGQVVRCVDHKTGGLMAIKIIRNKKRFHQQALVEVNILQKLREWDPHDTFSMVNFTQSFYFRGHLCISTELLGMNLYEFIKIHDFKGFSVKLIRRFTKQLLNSLVLLKSHRVIHCDLKPENILLAHPAHSEIKVIDFGSSCLENEKVYTYIQSRFYRSPEVILGMTYGMPIDMWSLGCILAELLTGYPIFPGENEQEQLACIMEVFGPPDKHLIEKSTRKKLFFDSLGKPRLTISSKGKRRRPSSRTLQQTLKCDDEVFLDFVARCLRWDPDRRLKPDEAISHEFVTGIKSTSRLARTMQSSTALTNSSSPIKRYNSVHTPASMVRPLPEVPSSTLKNGTLTRNQERQTTRSNSPSKGAPKRHSTMTGLQNGAGNKRAPAVMSISALPRLGGSRLASGKSDMASAAAAAATTRMR